MREIIEALEPKLVWKNFYLISQIPRCSKHEEQLRDFLIQFAKEHGCTYKVDDVGNLVIKKPASPGMEDRPGCVIQGHMDMVCEKNKDTQHDFSKDPIKLKVEDGWVTAEGTTLGADNGIAIAMAMAIIEDENVQHPPMEFLFTVDEETGLTGASSLKSDFVEGKYLLNIDSEEETTLFIGCAGGQNTILRKKIEWLEPHTDHTTVLLKVGGLRGGHSGLNIHQGLGNAIKLLGRLLYHLDGLFHYHISAINGGSAHNAIPREAEAVLDVPEDQLDALKAFAQNYEKIFKDELKFVDKDVTVKIEEHARAEKVFSTPFKDQLVRLLYVMPHGVMAMSHAIEGLVETSTNMAIITTKGDEVEMLTSQRSSIASSITDISDRVKALGELAGFEVKQTDGYPAWQPNPDSKLLQICKSIYAEKFGKEPEVTDIHAGLECGIIGEKYEGMDMISFGPDILGAHSPDEKIRIESVQHVWEYLLEVLKKIN
ncbi:aminoacyl-histidine dipeptidase [Caldithrix abyssi DSM 13497]|uniref:Cytosol non-specific dipeptidase n=1 Tax=Caldithrix abyssi DSM 13497 TaxID=880073 RepID=H1XPK0_CALAY|nr:aminoacyl-histidine dipeptidase [Caldithrix abyssi]APF19822.1 dipeptidase D [Caldithrix abyssi DSM 13497]EHO39921.1 aminoacyl-histidine dipeptidase [Caldithrix abyssi DSM 13497]